MKCALLKPKSDIKDKEKFIKYIEDKVVKTIKKYGLFNSKEKIMVAVSGGKDSTSILSILKSQGYNLIALTVNSEIECYSESNLKNIRNVCKNLDIKLIEVSLIDEFGYSLREIIKKIKAAGFKLKSCSICGVLRRYILNKKAKQLKCTCVVTGHNLNDEAEAILMNLLYNRVHLMARLGPNPGISNSNSFVRRVKPLYFISEQEVINYSLIKKFPVNYAACPCASESYRNSVRQIINHLDKKAPYNIVNYLLSILPKLKKAYKNNIEIKLCECGEPCVKNKCRACEILGVLND